MNLRAIIVDDEPNNVENLRALVNEYCPQVAIVGIALNAAEARELIQQESPELIFLDIQMPATSGFDLLRGIPQIDFEVIFVTAFDSFAIQAMRFSAIDYLLKPVNIHELQEAVKRAEVQSELKTQNKQLQNLMHMLKAMPAKSDHQLALSSIGETRFVKVSRIIRCESSNNYTTFYLNGGESIVVSKPIYEYESMLSEYGFIRCHQSHLVNKDFIRSWKKEDGDFLCLEDGSLVPVSRGKREAVKEILRL